MGAIDAIDESQLETRSRCTLEEEKGSWEKGKSELPNYFVVLDSSIGGYMRVSI